jgi:hypothetical protein
MLNQSPDSNPPQIHNMKNKNFLSHRRKAALASLIGVITISAFCNASAQTVTMRANPVRITVPVGEASPNPVVVLNSEPPVLTNVIPVTVVTSQLPENSAIVNFSLTGVPTGVTASFGTNSISDNGTHTVFLTISTSASVPAGTHDMAIVASGGANYRLPLPVICSYVWTGANYTNNVTAPGNLNDAGNWAGGALPISPTADIVFRESGATTNIAGPTTTNILITTDKEVGSVRFAQEYRWTTNTSHNIAFESGAKLSVTGPDGFKILRDSKAAPGTVNVRMFGNGSLAVINPTAMFGTFVDFQVITSLDLRELDSLQVDVSRLPFGDYRTYPNYYTNGWQGTGIGSGGVNEVNRFVSRVQLAKTNVLKASFVDPNNYNDLGQRDYAMTIGNNNVQASTTDLWLQFGYSNALFLDSICFAQAISGSANSRFGFRNPGFDSYILIRGTGGLNSRMSVFAVVDTASPAPPNNGANRGNVNFLGGGPGGGSGQGGGTVDALVDRLMISQDRTNNNNQMTVQGSLTFGAGIFDINTAYLGYQRSGDNLGSASSTGMAGPEGTLNVNSNAAGAGILRINSALHLGYTTASAPGGTTSAERCWGRLTVSNATAMVNTIAVGGITKLSTNNQIHLSNSKLYITNKIGSADGRIANFIIAGSSEIILSSATVGESSIFVRTMSAPAAGGVKYIRIPTLNGVVSYPATVPVISYTSDSSPVLSGLSITPPAGLYVKSVVDNTANKTIDVTFTDEPPTVVVWRGTVNNQWDTSTPNWVTQVGGVQTNFSEGFSVIFDNTVGAGPTTIEIPSPVTPGQVAAAYGILVENQSYTFNTGSVLGTATIRKQGTGDLTINANFSPGLSLAQGALLGSSVGVVGSTTLESGATMTSFLGTINGGLIVSNATVIVNGPVNGGLNLQSGSLANASTINGVVSLASGTALENRLGGIMNVTLPWTVTTNSTLINNGDIFHFGNQGDNLGLNVDGTLKGVGRIIQNGFQASSDVRVTLRAGGNLMIGNTVNEITNMTIAVRLDLLEGSTTTIDVNNSIPVNDQITLAAGANGFGKVNFGAGNNQGATVQINRISGPAFNLATVLYPFDQVFNQPDNGQPAIPKLTPPPAPGLVWNTYEVITNLTLSVVNPPQITNTITSTNFVFEWPADYRGWRLERQISTLDVGLDWSSTNWTTVFTALGGTNVLYYPDITNSPDIYWIRQTTPINKTDPAVFYRVTYP